MPTHRKLAIADIDLDESLQPRESMNMDAVADYAEALRAAVDDPAKAAVLPSLTVFFDGEKYRLADGFHRVFAHKSAGLTHALCLVHMGSKRDALLYSCGANAQHGLRRTNADKRRAVEKLLADEEWGGWSDEAIAAHAKVSGEFVRKLRNDPTSNGGKSAARKTRNGRVMNTANIGRKSKKNGERAAGGGEFPKPNESGVYEQAQHTFAWTDEKNGWSAKIQLLRVRKGVAYVASARLPEGGFSGPLTDQYVAKTVQNAVQRGAEDIIRSFVRDAGADSSCSARHRKIARKIIDWARSWPSWTLPDLDTKTASVIPPNLQAAGEGEAATALAASPDEIQPQLLPAGEGEAAEVLRSAAASPNTRLVRGGDYSQEELLSPGQLASELRHELDLAAALRTLAKARIPAAQFDKLCPPCLRREFDDLLDPAYAYLEELRFNWEFSKELEDEQPRANHQKELVRANADPDSLGRHTAPQRGRML